MGVFFATVRACFSRLRSELALGLRVRRLCLLLKYAYALGCMAEARVCKPGEGLDLLWIWFAVTLILLVVLLSRARSLPHFLAQEKPCAAKI